MSHACTRRITQMEEVESRLLFAFTVMNPVADFSVAPGTSSSTVDISNVINTADISGTVVRFDTSVGNIDLSLFDADKPITVANFLSYVNNGSYNGTFIHGAQNKTDTNPAFVPASDTILGGGYDFPGFEHVATQSPIQDETTTNGVHSNVRGTIAMSKNNAPNTATSDWFINSGNNPALDSTALAGGFTVFGQLINNTITTVDAIDAIPRYDFGGPFSELPLRNYSSDDLIAATDITDQNLVLISNASVIPKVTYAVSSSNSALVNPTIDANTLTLNYGGGTGSATITLTGTGLDGTVATDTFDVGVGTLDVVVGSGAAKQVAYTDADGTAGVITVKGGAATVSFNGSGLTKTVGKKGVVVTGPVGSLASITLSGTTGASTLTFKAKGGNGVLNVEDIGGGAALKSLAGKQVSVSGALNLGSAGKIDLASISGGSLTVGGAAPVSISVGAVQNSNLDISAPVKSLKIASFSGASNHLNAGSLSKLTVSGDFAGSLNVASPANVKVNGSVTGAAWSIGRGGKFAIGGALGVDVTGTALASLKAGTLSNADIRISGPIGKITSGGIAGSTIFSRVTPAALPSNASDLGAGGSISSVSNRGAFSNSSIAALVLGKLSLGDVTTSNGGTAFGVAGGTIASVTAVAPGGSRIKLTKLTTADQTFTRGDFVARVF